MAVLTLKQAEEASGLDAAALLDLVARGVLRAHGTGAELVFDRHEFDAWRRPRLPDDWAELLNVPANATYAGLDRAPKQVRHAMEKFLRDVHTTRDPMIPVPSVPDRVRFVRYSASSGNDLQKLWRWLLKGPPDGSAAGEHLEEDEWE